MTRGAIDESQQKDSLKLLYVEVFPADIWDVEDLETFWVLSTGRCGTATLDRLLALSSNLASYHEPMPRLHRYHALALNNWRDLPTFFENLIYDCRIDLMSAMKQMGYKYVECQHRWTPYAPLVKRVFPNTKFIYLMRNMDHFVSSALQWHWYDLEKEKYYSKGCQEDEGKLLASFWCKTNEFIQNFLKNIPRKDWIFFDFNTIRAHNWNKIRELYEWMGAEVPRLDEIEFILNKQFNRGRKEPVKKRWGEFDERAQRIYENARKSKDGNLGTS